VIDRSYALSMLDADAPFISERERLAHPQPAASACVSRARGRDLRATGETLLIVAQKRIVAQLRAMGELAGDVVWPIFDSAFPQVIESA